jgi:hypothetical protein
MKYSINLFVTAHLLIAASCTAMENKVSVSEPKIITELGTIKKPYSLICLSNNTVAIAGEKGCSIYDYSTNKEIITLQKNTDPTNFPYIAAHPNKQLLAIHSEQTLTIYETKTSTIIGKIKSAFFKGSPVFNPINDTVLINNGQHIVDSFDYTTNFCTSISVKNANNATLAAFHPTKEECLLISDKFSNSKILQCAKKPIVKKKVPTGSYNPVCNHSIGYQYNFDGSFIAFHNPEGNCYIFEDPISTHLSYNDYTSSYGVTFHPNSFILATLLFKPSWYFQMCICYWNAKTKKLIAATPLKIKEPVTVSDWPRPISTQCIDFSLDGTKVIIALRNKCLVLEVPLDALYQPKTKDKYLFTYCLLKKYQCNQDYTIPNEIIHIMMQYLLEVSKYSRTNY